MELFNISRINTELGIFRISGHLSAHLVNSEFISYKSLQIMGTDGWISLNVSSNENSQLLSDLKPIILQHLLSENG
ncbi:hypothetical protein [Parashewanella tropica]|uniref:hypothetical protein n=1 Tax=Parashewanella tropica TaxID=2547970 RepID=UPI0010595216|nr:hypothetical protein [Parashewanella tropica]